MFWRFPDGSNDMGSRNGKRLRRGNWGGASFNGELLPLSVPLAADKAGGAMPRYQLSEYVPGQSELLLMSNTSRTSFDGGYFGQVYMGQVRGVIRPIIVF